VSAECVRCGAPTDATVCRPDALSLAETLVAASGHAEDAEAVIARQTRHGTGGGAGSGDPLPYDPVASVRLGAVAMEVRFWTEDLRDGEPLPTWRRMTGPRCKIGVRCPHSSCAALRVINPPSYLAQAFQWLSGQTEALRRHPAADEAFARLHAACADLERLNDGPADKELVGMCDCGKVLYAPRGKGVVTCPVPTCKLNWDVAKSREILRKALDERLVTAGEAAHLGAYLDTDRTQKQIRALVDAWARRSVITARGKVEGEPDEDGQPTFEPTYRFGDIASRMAVTPRRGVTRSDGSCRV
jgi:hypothetical protein